MKVSNKKIISDRIVFHDLDFCQLYLLPVQVCRKGGKTFNRIDCSLSPEDHQFYMIDKDSKTKKDAVKHYLNAIENNDLVIINN